MAFTWKIKKVSVPFKGENSQMKQINVFDEYERNSLLNLAELEATLLVPILQTFLAFTVVVAASTVLQMKDTACGVTI